MMPPPWTVKVLRLLVLRCRRRRYWRRRPLRREPPPQTDRVLPQRQRLYDFLLEDGLLGGVGDVNERGFPADRDGFAHGADGEIGIDRRRPPTSGR
jgi:hypothetical protein